jgi:AI-2 transport protein TqsA
MSSQLKQQQNWLVTASLSVLALVAIAFVLRYTSDVLIPFVIAIFVGSLVSPLMDVMELKWKWKHGVSVIAALLVVLLATALFGAVLFGCINTILLESKKQQRNFLVLSDNIEQKWQSFVGGNEEVAGTDLMDDKANEVSPAESGQSETNGSESDQTNAESAEPEKVVTAEESKPDLADSSNGSTSPEDDAEEESPMQEYVLGLIPQLAAWVAGTTLNLFSAGTLTLIFVMFVLAGRDPRIVRQGVYQEIDTQVRSYITTKVALSLATGVLVWTIFRVIEMPMPVVFGVVAFLLNFIPSVGSIISTLVPIPFALAFKAEVFAPNAIAPMNDIAWLLAVICLPGCVQMLIGNVLEPKLMGDDLQLHPIAILLALAIWGLLWGPVGMLLAVPMTAIIRIVLMKFEITRIAGEALAGKLPDLDAFEKKAAAADAKAKNASDPIAS